MKQRFILISTSDMQSGRSSELTRMIHSVQAWSASAPHIEPVLFVLAQRCNADELKALRETFPSWIRWMNTETRVSLSNARNILLGPEAAGSAISADDIVGFPDDDCWYPQGTLTMISRAFEANPQLDFWFCRYSSAPNNNPTELVGFRPSLQTVISRASSNTIFVRGRLATLVGGFDPDLGVGAQLAGGEDTDYALRAFRQARETLFVDGAVVGHRDPDKRLRGKYYPGALRAISNNASGNSAWVAALVRKLAVGLWLILKRQMTPRTYLFALSNIVNSRKGR
ncbi:hypothetical protein FHX15_004499 [Rhizobium sp. BK650]|uniref:glycosyltransferase family 2 protein n=1 Tax=Rhizobium sp. BK650 TaxID=2586990 RepID=UPI00160A6AD1|nr:glycosyltransferase family 2 protein [Rhizobium sp. BK650]MBB3659235.1 hypothetical protein [Rhizobium sp. BK650]